MRGEPGTAEFIASFNEAVATKKVPPPGRLVALLCQFQESEDFRRLATETQRGYVKMIARIEKHFGDFPLAALSDRRTRGIFLEWRDKLALTSRRQADYAWTVFARILSWGVDRGHAIANPCAHGGKLYRSQRIDKIWTPRDEAAFLARARADFHLPLMLALWTGQRQATCCACRGPHTTALISACDNPRRDAASSSPWALRSKSCLIPRRAFVQSSSRVRKDGHGTPIAFRSLGGRRASEPPSSALHFMTCAERLSRGLLLPDARRRKSRPSPVTR